MKIKNQIFAFCLPQYKFYNDKRQCHLYIIIHRKQYRCLWMQALIKPVFPLTLLTRVGSAILFLTLMNGARRKMNTYSGRKREEDKIKGVRNTQI